MADAILDFLTQLGEALVVAFRYEYGVVAETFGAVLLGGDGTVHDALKLVDFLDAGATTRAHVLFLYVTNNGAETAWRFSFPSSSWRSFAMLASLSWSVPSA